MRHDTYKLMANNQNTFWWYVVRCEILHDNIKKLFLKKDAKILEIGCGTGANITMLKSLFTNVDACEYNEYARNYTKETFAINVKNAELPDNLPYENETFDLILLCDVLEHIQNDRKTLEIIKLKLKPKGYLLITVPAHPFLWSYTDVIAHHFRRYTKKTLQHVVDDVGFDNIYERYFMQILFPIAILVRFIKNIMYKKDGELKANNKEKYCDAQVRNISINWILKIIFRIEKYLVIKNFLGLSILKIIKKPSLK